jgi:site-specific recombinase XerD
MADEDIRMLLQAILDYFQWLKPGENLRGSKRYGQILIEFVIFAIHEDIAWKELFTFDTFREFRKYTMVKNTSHAIISLSGYLHEKGRIDQPLQIPNYQVHLPHIYEQYLLYLEQAKEVSKHHVTSSRRVLASLNQYLENHKIALSALKIEHLDAFLLEFNKPFSMNTQKRYLCRLRDFLNYLYYERKVLRRDLAPLLKGPVQFGQSKPPKFLRSEEIQKLFATLTLNTPTQIRTYAMVHLAYSLGLRPVEISKITLDDISFQKAELIIPKRKTTNPVILPIPDKTLKAIAAYVLKARPKTAYREVFLTAHAPYRPVSSSVVIAHISKAMKKAGLCSTSYWLRHSYAQNLLQIGRSIYEIKEMLGHENIQSTQRYLHIHTELMRKVLFDETL